MEQRQHPRIQIPLLVEINHAALGTVQTTARDISEGGLFVCLENPAINVGSKLKLRLLTVLPTDTQPTPTVDMEVKRIAEDGLGLAFINRTAQHLWNSVQRLRSELEIGRDYFQVHQSLALIHEDKGLLLVQQNGKWLLPGYYLMVGEDAAQSALDFAARELGMTPAASPEPVAANSAANSSVAEAAVYSVTLTAQVTEPTAQLGESSPYKDWRWLNKQRDLNEITFASDAQRDLVRRLVEQLQET